MNQFKTTNTQMQVQQLLGLQLGLTEFGLRPTEWQIVQKNSQKFMIQNTDENNFYFIGEVQPTNKNKWKSIRLASL